MMMTFNPASEKQPPRVQIRKACKPEPSVDESFEDLLSKYRQIQLELECIRREETEALEPPGGAQTPDHTTSITPSQPEPGPGPGPGPGPAPPDPAAEDLLELQKVEEKKVFHAFNIKPLRQKLPTPAVLQELRSRREEQEGGGGGAEQQGEQTGSAFKI